MERGAERIAELESYEARRVAKRSEERMFAHRANADAHRELELRAPLLSRFGEMQKSEIVQRRGRVLVDGENAREVRIRIGEISIRHFAAERSTFDLAPGQVGENGEVGEAGRLRNARQLVNPTIELLPAAPLWDREPHRHAVHLRTSVDRESRVRRVGARASRLVRARPTSSRATRLRARCTAPRSRTHDEHEDEARESQ